MDHAVRRKSNLVLKKHRPAFASARSKHFDEPQDFNPIAGCTRRLLFAVDYIEKFAGYGDEHVISLELKGRRLPIAGRFSGLPQHIRIERTLQRPKLANYCEAAVVGPPIQIKMNRHAEAVVFSNGVHIVVRGDFE